ncbi:MAG TPA: SRPBCC family protein [Jatrophihabitans sp.]|nr:SRPBCC family protein [Jatrophihabitans sp.]
MSSVVHDSFVIERTYPAAPERVFAAWASQKSKSQWFGDAEGVTAGDHSLDFAVGGREHLSVKAPDGTTYTFDATYQDIVENERIVWSYDMTVDGRRMSVSLGTVEIAAVSGGTRLTMTEQGVFLDALDTNEQRRQGTEELLSALGTYLSA